MGGIMDAFLVRFEDCPLAVSSPSLLLQARTSAPYSYQLTATGGRAPYVWSLAGFRLPDGITLSSSGLLSGTASTTQAESGEYQFTVAVRDADNRVAYKSMFLGISYPGNWYCESGLCEIQLSTNQSIIYQLPQLRSSEPPFSYNVSGSLPPGIMVSADGRLTGAATTGGVFDATVQITDALGASGSLNLRFTVSGGSSPPSTSPPTTPPSTPPSNGGTPTGGSSGGGAMGADLLLYASLAYFTLKRGRRIRA
jgi:hypothetical protein